MTEDKKLEENPLNDEKEEDQEEDKASDVSSDSFKYKDCENLYKNNKNLIAGVILLSGIAVGSFFVDVVQLFSQKGFSAKAIEDAQVIEYDGNTWVRYDDPKITVEVFDADDCKDCVTDEVLVRLRSLIPTLEAHRIDVRTAEGADYAKANDIKHIPAFLFANEVVESDFYQQAAILFKDNNHGKQYFEAPSVGVPIGEYLEVPRSDNAIVLGNADAKVQIVIYDNFTAKESAVTYPIIEKIRSEQKDNVNIAIKAVPDSEQKNSMDAALAMYCAHAQEKYGKYASILYRNHKSVTESDSVKDLLHKYAQSAQMDVAQFDTCIDNEKTKENIEKNLLEASQFGVVSAPTFFINGKPHVGVMTYQGLKEKIDAELAVDETGVQN